MIPQKPLFSNVKFYLIGLKNSNIEEKLMNNGAQKNHYLSDIITHCIANQYDDEVSEAMDLYQLKVVNSNWVEYSLKCQELLPTKPFEIEASPKIFTKLVFHLLGLSKKDEMLLWGLLIKNGGRVVKKYSDRVTHQIVNDVNLIPSKDSIETSPHIVVSDWVIESNNKKVKQPEDDYYPKMYEVCEHSADVKNDKENCKDEPSKADNIKNDLQKTSIQAQKTSVSNSANAFWLSKGIFDKIVFYIEDYRNPVGFEELLLWRKLIRAEGGSVVDGYTREVTHVLCSYQSSPHYEQAKSDGKELRTAYWLNDCLVHRKLLPPDPYLHTPFNSSYSKYLYPHVISVTNIRGYAKFSLKRLIKLFGGQCTVEFSKKNTLLIYEGKESQKLTKASQWGVPTISEASFYELLKSLPP